MLQVIEHCRFCYMGVYPKHVKKLPFSSIAAVIPPLSFPILHGKPSPAAARTQISIRLDKITFQEQEGDESDESDENFIPLSLSVLTANLSAWMFLTSHVKSTLVAACSILPSVPNLVLRLEEDALDEELWEFEGEGSSSRTRVS